MPRRKRREWEAEYVSEYCQQIFPWVPVIYHCRLGTWPTPLTAPELTPEEQRLLRVRMRWADAVVIERKKLILIEGKLRASEFLKGLGELLVYRTLIPHTAELAKYMPRPVESRLLIPIADPVVSAVAAQHDIRVVVYKPKFWEDFLKAIHPRQSRPIRPDEKPLIDHMLNIGVEG